MPDDVASKQPQPVAGVFHKGKFQVVEIEASNPGPYILPEISPTSALSYVQDFTEARRSSDG